MDRTEAKNKAKSMLPDFLTQAKKKINGYPTYVCPVCGNGSGKDGTGIALDKEKMRWKCFGCGMYEDVFGLWKVSHNLSDDKEAFTQVYEYYGIPVDAEYKNSTKQDETQHTHISIHTVEAKAEEAEPTENYTEYFLEAHKNMLEWYEQNGYLKSRGISLDTAKKYMIGIDYNWVHPSAKNGKTSIRVIIPTSNHTYTARLAGEPSANEPKVMKVGKAYEDACMMNIKALSNSTQPIFIVEGEFDAMSIAEVGGDAIALGSTSNINRFLKEVEKVKPERPLIVALDNDEAGRTGAEALLTGLQKLSVSCCKASPDIYGGHKDANELLQADRDKLEQNVIIEAEKVGMSWKDAYMRENNAYYALEDFLGGIAESVNTKPIPTGFPKLDAQLDGGLYEGLYVVGAISSLGKTTMVLQMADQIASAGQDVLIFSLEMAKSELIAKSISRLTLVDELQNSDTIENAKTTRGITTGSRYEGYSDKEKAIIKRAVLSYQQYANNVYIHEGVGNIGIEDVREEVKRHLLFTGNKPVVIIDYMQILSPADLRASDKQNIDKAVLEAKRISRDYKIPVVCISSLNRGGYDRGISMDSFKESGAIEYGSDVLIGLQLRGVGTDGFNVNDAKAKNPREVELVVLKNRNGKTGITQDFSYYPMFNYFEEM